MPAAIGNKAEIVDAVIEGVSRGTPLLQLCREWQVAKSTWYSWLECDGELSGRFAEARVKGFDAIAERLRLTARGLTEEAGGESSGDLQRDKLIIETDLKLLAKWDPKRYGELIKLAGADGEGAVTMMHLSADMTAEQASEIYTKLLG